MELKYRLMHSTDSRFINKSIRNFGGFCYYANHFERIIRNGCFLTGSPYMNGPGVLINYNDNQIVMKIGTFENDKNVNSHSIITSISPFYIKIDNIDKDQYYFCNAIQKKYKHINIELDMKKSQINNTKNVYLLLIVNNGKLIKCDVSDIIDKTLYNDCSYGYNDIFHFNWKHT